MQKPNELTAVSALKLMREGELSARQLMESCLQQIDEREDQVKAWQFIDASLCLAHAEDCDSGSWRGPLHGIPVAIKDIIDTSDMPTEYGTPIYNLHQPTADAACVARIRNAGGIIMGKTVTTELAYFNPGKTRNPHNFEHTPGGSSSGSAAAVADHMVPLALGTQTAASLTRPSAYCGITGYKASMGSYSMSGIKCFSHYLDSMGIMARCIDDIALLGSVMSSVDIQLDKISHPLKIAYCKTHFQTEADDVMHQCLNETSELLRMKGAEIETINLSDEFSAGLDIHNTIMAFEAARNYSYEYLNFKDLLSPQMVDLIEFGTKCSLSDYQTARNNADELKNIFATNFNKFDCVLTFSAPGEAPLASTGTGNPIFSRLWALLGLPSITIPVGVGDQGLPLGVQLIGAFNADKPLLEIVHWIQSNLS